MDGHDIGRGPAQHFLRVLSNLQDLPAELIHRNHSRFSGNNALALFKQQRGRGAHINGNISFKQVHALSPKTQFK